MDEMNQKPAPAAAAVYRFGLFALDVSAGALSRNGLRIRLQDQPLQLLALLLEKHGELVTREEIRQRLWESNTFVDFDKSLGVAVLKVREALGDSAANPRFLETVPRRGYRFIAPVSVESLSGRTHPGSNVTATTGPADGPLPQDPRSIPSHPDPRPTPPRRKFVWYLVAGVCGAVALAAAAYRLSVHPPKAAMPSPAAASQLKLRRSVAVLGFRNLAGGVDQNWLSSAFTEMLNTELATSGDLRLVSGEDVANVKHDLSLPDEGTLARSTLARLRSSLGADVVVVGSYTLLNDGGKNRIRLDIRAQDTALGETILEDALTGNENDLFDLASQAGSRLRETLDPSISLAPASETPRFSGSSNQLAVQFYSEGRARLYEFDFVGARDLLTRAIAADPDFAIAHSALSSALSSLGYGAQAQQEARRALQHAQTLPSEMASVIRGQYQESVLDWTAAAQTYADLFHLFPDNLTYGLQLARAQLQANPAEAERTLTQLRLLPPPMGQDPRIDLMEASASITEDLPRARTAAQTAIAKASTQHATLMVARGYGILCEMDSAASVPLDQAISECNLARNSYISAGDLNNAARTLSDFAVIYYQRGDLAKAQAMWLEAIEVFRKVGDKEGLAAASNNVGDALLDRGKLSEARKLLEEALEQYRQAGDRSGTALALVDLGEVDLMRAALPAAVHNDEEAIKIATLAADKSSTAYGLAGLGDALLMQDKLTDARKQYEMALKLRKEIGEKGSILQTRVALARLSIEDGHAQDAGAEVLDCVNQIHHEQMPDDEIDAGIVFAEAMLALKKNAEAHNELDKVHPLTAKTLHRGLQLRFSLELARVQLAEGNAGASRTLLAQVAKDAAAEGFAGLSWEAQLDLARAQAQSGDLPGASKQLSLVETRARNAEFLLLARKAAAIKRQLASPG